MVEKSPEPVAKWGKEGAACIDSKIEAALRYENQSMRWQGWKYRVLLENGKRPYRHASRSRKEMVDFALREGKNGREEWK